jgi:flagellar biosynthetic protein FliR
MHGDLHFPAAALFGFLLCLARVSGIAVFVPIPGFRSGSDAARIVFAVALSLVLAPSWPSPPSIAPTVLQLTGWVLAQAFVGMGIGLAVAMLLEGFQIAAQILALQAGYSYASMIDPGSEADSGILQVWTQLAAAFLFFAAGLDHAVIRAVAAGLQTPAPAGGEPVAAVSKLGTEMFALSVRLAFPVVVLVLLLDLALALTGRMQAQLQLLALAFPAKMLAAILLLSFLTAAFPPVFERAAAVTLRLLPALAR